MCLSQPRLSLHLGLLNHLTLLYSLSKTVFVQPLINVGDVLDLNRLHIILLFCSVMPIFIQILDVKRIWSVHFVAEIVDEVISISTSILECLV